NVAVGAAGLVISRGHCSVGRDEAPEAESKGNWVIYYATAVSGFGALGAEVIWTRLLSMLLGGTVYTFSIILAVFLAGLGIGSNLASTLASRIVRPRLAFAWCQIFLMLACGWAGYAICVSLPNWPVNPALSPEPWVTFQIDMARCL